MTYYTILCYIFSKFKASKYSGIGIPAESVHNTPLNVLISTVNSFDEGLFNRIIPLVLRSPYKNDDKSFSFGTTEPIIDVVDARTFVDEAV